MKMKNKKIDDLAVEISKILDMPKEKVVVMPLTCLVKLLGDKGVSINDLKLEKEN